ncbi:thioredoxin family protein [Rhodobacter sp. HX-7-19]|uniref:Thioredoxin family protein n=1 Tax=Paragemmobacter kunshanensis TaxID=2583234 RepID=A0A6M1TTZ5_9RHOB|nr:thioredoxin family protein [Rhodobacter kunshanensis]
MLRAALVALALLLAWAAPMAQAQGLQLAMVEQPGCIYCARWHAEVGPEYPLTAEGIAAPLLQLQLREPLPDGVTLRAPPVFTPTFILLRDGTELSRIEGYPGEDFFWPLLAQMIAAAGN